jgi:hypothetical protein
MGRRWPAICGAVASWARSCLQDYSKAPHPRNGEWRNTIQSQAPAGTAWTRAPGGATMRNMPLELTDLELETAARACRALAYQEEQAAKRMENPAMRGPIENASKRYRALAEKFETARRNTTTC